jgi:hypothetical protein
MKCTCKLMNHCANHPRFVGLLMNLEIYLWPDLYSASFFEALRWLEALSFPILQNATSIFTVDKSGYSGILPALLSFMVLRDKVGSAYTVHQRLLACKALLFQLLLCSCQVSEAQRISPVELALSLASTLETTEVPPCGCLPHSCRTKVKQKPMKPRKLDNLQLLAPQQLPVAAFQVFGGPDGATSIPQIKSWWLWPSDENRMVVLDGRALLDNLRPQQACDAFGFAYTGQCQVPFPGESASVLVYYKFAVKHFLLPVFWLVVS